MTLSDHDPDIDQTLIDEVLAHVTDIKAVNDSVKSYVDGIMQEEEGPEVYWCLYAMRTKEILIAVLAQL